MSCTGPRLTWDNTSDFILLSSLLSETKIGSGGWEAASAKLAEKGFLSSTVNSIEAWPRSQPAVPPPPAAEGTPATPKRTLTGRAKRIAEQKAAAKATREAKKAAGANPTKGVGHVRLGIAKESPYVDNDDGKTKDEGDSDEPMMAKLDENYGDGTPSRKRRMGSIVKKVEKIDINDPAESAGSADMDISDSQ